ncbi:MptD family putative ECF transporter S component [Actinokineospora sp. HBU206404]|uniref:MptD family putative ECF transporter S component n=2 Tax=Actinokineospora xionganensis TaxID=2684470 RepID=A0ABR7L496_9PSEU|nr:MptD family putative ECF transporter S component [Actinokineospora xionganensis]
MSPRDLINIGIFAALYLATVGVLNALEFIGPLATLVSIVVSIIAGGVPFMLFLTRVKHAGMVTVFAVIVNAFMLLIGSPAIALVLGVLLALVAEALLWLGRYRSRKLSVVAYAVFSMWFAGLFLPMFYAREDYLSGEYMQSMGQEYRDALDAFLSPGVLAAFDLSTFLFGLIGGVLGLRLLDKHFRKAGIA